MLNAGFSPVTLRRQSLLALCTLAVLAGCVTRAPIASLPPPAIEVSPPAITFSNLIIGPPVHASIAPPPLPLYAQPPCPEDGYLWIPGYWHYGPMGYYWVPGTWVEPPQAGLLWTPGYWDFVAGIYAFNAGYWSPHIGFYGGVNYSHGYSGSGYDGGQWVGSAFSYNTAVTNINATGVHSTYTQAVVSRGKLSRVSYNGGPGGTRAKATVQERAVAQEPHFTPNPQQQQHAEAAAHNPALAVQRNGGHPTAAMVADARPLAPAPPANLPGLAPPRVAAKPTTAAPHKLAAAATPPAKATTLTGSSP
jgi:hypothetical protein